MTIYGRIYDDEDEYPGFVSAYERDDDDDPESACAECGKPGVDGCQCCGLPLCGMHSEIGAGFCKDCPTMDWIQEQR